MIQVLRVKGKYTATIVYTAGESGPGLPVKGNICCNGSKKSENMLILPICSSSIK